MSRTLGAKSWPKFLSRLWGSGLQFMPWMQAHLALHKQGLGEDYVSARQPSHACDRPLKYMVPVFEVPLTMRSPAFRVPCSYKGTFVNRAARHSLLPRSCLQLLVEKDPATTSSRTVAFQKPRFRRFRFRVYSPCNIAQLETKPNRSKKTKTKKDFAVHPRDLVP